MTKTMLLAMLLSGGLDFASTEYSLAGGNVEAHPWGQHRAVRVIGCVGAPLLIYALLKDKPKAAKWIGSIYVGAHLGVSAHNFYIGAKVRW